MSESEQYVPIEKVAKHFSVSVSTIRAWIRQGKVPRHTFMKLGTTYRFKLSAVESALVGGDEPEVEVEVEVVDRPKPITLY